MVGESFNNCRCLTSLDKDLLGDALTDAIKRRQDLFTNPKRTKEGKEIDEHRIKIYDQLWDHISKLPDCRTL